VSTAPTPFVTAPPTIISQTTDFGGDGRTPEMWSEGAGGAEHYTLIDAHALVYASLT